jgi:alpha-mannan endo-1,2-alpha-mannanase / glycoprotein endo-alpha-1,2-mannosidase
MNHLNLFKTLLLLPCFLCLNFFVQGQSKKPNDRVFTFYYNWYGNEQQNGREIHWAHGIIRKSPSDPPAGRIPGGDNLASNFFPQLRNYSSTDPVVVAKHMNMMAEARIGVVVLTWWRKADFGSEAIPLIMDEAQKKGLKVCFHLEPYPGRNAASVRQDIAQILDTYGKHPAFYRTKGKPLFFIYDSYLTKAEEWAGLLNPKGAITIRKTPLDAVMIGLWVRKGEEPFFEKSGFDGYYTYFGSTNFTYGASPANWNYLQQWAAGHDKIFIPCVGPGYIDTRVRPWNGSTTKDRENGKYYDRMFQAAIQSKAAYIGITSFNEWHEGTQIEPAIPYGAPDFKYADYSPLAPDYYLKRTAYWVGQLEKSGKK